MIVAIDGPSGAGKGTIARALAAALHCRHIDSGAMYRAVAWRAVAEHVPLDDEPAIARLAEGRIDLEGGRVLIDGHDVTHAIRTPEIDRAAAAVARLPAVRAVLVDKQRRLGETGGVVMEGRDIGTVVFPHADVKIYLDAAPEERARRRAADPAHASSRGLAVAEVATALEARDRLDSTRAASPLMAAPDAVHIDTTCKSIDAVLQEVMGVVERRRKELRMKN